MGRGFFLLVLSAHQELPDVWVEHVEALSEERDEGGYAVDSPQARGREKERRAGQSFTEVALRLQTELGGGCQAGGDGAPGWRRA